jgi:hypothetical protein
VVLAANRYCFQSLTDNLFHIGFKKCCGVHGTDKLASIEAVPVVHDAPEFVTELNHLIWQSQTNQAVEICFYLVINIVCVGIKLRMPGIRWGYILSQEEPASALGSG